MYRIYITYVINYKLCIIISYIMYIYIIYIYIYISISIYISIYIYIYIYKDELLETKYLNNIQKNRILKVNKSLFKLEKDFKEVRDKELKDREI